MEQQDRRQVTGEPGGAVRFATAARALTDAASSRGLRSPGFRAPPRLPGVDRSIRRRDGAALVSVKVRGRPWPAVLADMIEGVVVANSLSGADALRVRAQLWEAVGASLERSAA